MARSVRSRVLLVAAASAVAAVAVYARVVTLGFAYDDEWTIVRNSWLERPLSWLLRTVAAGEAARMSIPDATRPTMIASLWLDRRLFGLDPAGYHAHSLLWYAASSALVSLWLFVLSKRVFVALLGGLFFAVAPIHAEVVAAVNYREDLIASIGALLVLVWVFAPKPRPEFVDWIAVVATVWFLSLLAKASALAVVPLIAALAAVRGVSWQWWAARWRSWTAFFLVVAAWGAWRLWLRIADRDDVPATLEHWTWSERLTRTARFELHTLGDALVPIAWSPDHAPPSEAGWLWVGALLAVVVGICVLARYRRTQLIAMGLTIGLTAPLPMSPLVGPYNELADRYAYLAVAGGGLLWGSVLLEFRRLVAERRGVVAKKRIVVAVAGVALGVLVWLTQPAVIAWRSNFTLWQVATERAPGSARAWTGWSRTLRLRGKLDEAEAAVDRAVQLDPTFLRARVTRIYTLLAQGEVGRAREEIRRVIGMGGVRQPGMRRAIRCANKPAAEAARCIDQGLEPLSAVRAQAPGSE